MWSDDLKSKYLSTKVGSEITMKIKAITKVTNKPDYEPKTKDGVGQGFLFEFTGEDDSVVSIGTFTLQRLLVDAGIDVGDTVKIAHPEREKYTVEKI